MRRLFGWAAVMLAVVSFPAAAREVARAVQPATVLVTSAADVGATTAACPDAVKCTLRKAIGLVNADASADPFIISFSPAVFPAAQPATITIGATALPPITHPNVTVDGTGAGVVIDGAGAAAGADGLRQAGNGSVVRGLTISNFRGACIAVEGVGAVIGGEADGEGNRLPGCGIGVLVSAAGATVRGNRIGFGAGGAPESAVGVQVSAGTAVIGGESIGTGGANVVGGVSFGVRVGEPAGAAFDGVVVGRNVFGRDGLVPAPLDIGVQLRQRSSGTRVAANSFSNARLADIQVVPDDGGLSVAGNTFRANTFEGGPGMAIDLNADAIRNANDPADADSGPNGLLNHPVFTRATQARVMGTACPGCEVELYYARHTPGGAKDEGSSPVPVGIARADTIGAFVFEAPPLSPGTWVTALATDAQGNTSEFAQSSRVGAGVIQCGNPVLQAGWNHDGYFGAEPVALGANVPGDPEHRIRAIYRLVNGDGRYDQWLRDSAIGRTLTSLDPGEAYWFLVDSPVSLPGGFALNQPLAAPLKAGWNELVYFGATADVRDALATVGGTYQEVHHWPGGGMPWLSWGDPGTPAWARGLSELESCSTYLLKVTVDGTLVPPQP